MIKKWLRLAAQIGWGYYALAGLATLSLAFFAFALMTHIDNRQMQRSQLRFIRLLDMQEQFMRNDSMMIELLKDSVQRLGVENFQLRITTNDAVSLRHMASKRVDSMRMKYSALWAEYKQKERSYKETRATNIRLVALTTELEATIQKNRQQIASLQESVREKDFEINSLLAAREGMLEEIQALRKVVYETGSAAPAVANQDKDSDQETQMDPRYNVYLGEDTDSGPSASGPFDLRYIDAPTDPAKIGAAYTKPDTAVYISLHEDSILYLRPRHIADPASFILYAYPFPLPDSIEQPYETRLQLSVNGLSIVDITGETGWKSYSVIVMRNNCRALYAQVIDGSLRIRHVVDDDCDDADSKVLPVFRW